MKQFKTIIKSNKMEISQIRNWTNKMITGLMVLLLSCTFLVAQGQSRVITGQIIDDSGIPLPGATILVKGSTDTGTTTDFDGTFSLSVEGNPTLVISFVGYLTQEVEIGDGNELNVILKSDAQTLDEVVVIGYGIQKKSDVTGAISSVDAKSISEVPATNVAQALQGRIAGVNLQQTSTRPGSDMQIRIRGNRSLGGGESNNPLIVLDGIPYLGSLNSINQGDIESIDILKDASATAIYGSRGSNGVIIITTKKGREGQSTVTYNGYAGISSPIAKYDVFNGQEFAELVQDSRFGPFTAAETESILNSREVNWQDLMLKDGYMTNHEVGFSGGTSTTQYLASGAYFEETSALPGQKFTRYSLRVNLDHQLSSRFKVGISSFASYRIRDGEFQNPFGGLLTFSPLVEPYTDEGEINRNFYQGHIDEPFNVNPLLLYNFDLWEQKRKELQSFNSLYGEFEILDGLRYRINLGADVSFNRYGGFTSGQLNRSSGVNSADVSNSTGANYTVENLLLYNKTLGNHNIGFTGLFSVQENEWNSQGFQVSGVTSDQLLHYNLALGNVVQAQGQNYSKWGLMSYMARVNYGFSDKYLITLTGRADGSSRLAEGNKWFYYPAVALGWNMHNESFLSGVDFLDALKLRLSVGRTSNQAISPFQSLGRLSPIQYSFGPDGGEFGYYVTNLPNTDLTWEFTTAYNLGVDFAFADYRVSGSLELYRQDTDDILQNRTLPIMSGVAGTFQQNIGQTQNQGIEVNLNTRIIEPSTVGGFGWEIDWNFTSWNEKIVKLVDTLQSDINNGWFVGYPIDVVYDYTKIGIWQLGEEEAATAFENGTEPGDIKVADLNGNGIRDEGDRSVLGALNPDWMGGLTTRFTYQGFDLSSVFFLRVGGLIVSSLHQNQSLEGRRNQLDVDYWTPDNPSNDYPIPGDQFPAYRSTLGYFDGTFGKIRSINFGYTVPAPALTKLGMKSARLYVTANNPFRAFFSDLVKAGAVDPEPNRYGGTLTPGFGNRLNMDADTPIMRSFIFGMNLSF